MKTMLTVSGRGVVTIPLDLRRALGIKADDTLIAETTADGLLLRPAVTLPIEIYTDTRQQEFDAEEKELADAMQKKQKPQPPTRRKRRS